MVWSVVVRLMHHTHTIHKQTKHMHFFVCGLFSSLFFHCCFFFLLFIDKLNLQKLFEGQKKRAIGIHWSCFFYTNILIVLINWSDSFFLCTLINSNLIEFLFISLYCSLANEWKPDNEPWKNLASEFYWTMKKKTWWTMNNIFLKGLWVCGLILIAHITTNIFFQIDD